VSYKLYKLLTGLQMDLENACSTVGSKLKRRKKTLLIQVIFFALFFVAFLIYMPIGTALAPQAQRLSIDDCIDKGLGETYCEVTMRLNSTSTTLYDDGTCQALLLCFSGISNRNGTLSVVNYRKDVRHEPNARGGPAWLHPDTGRILHLFHYERLR
jgi:hypothetical protein